MAQKVKHKAYPVQEWGGLVWAYMGRAGRDARVPAAGLGADRRNAREHREGARCRATGRRSSKARSTRRTARACTRPTWCRRASTAPRRPTRRGCGRRPTRRRACRCSAPATASATRRCAGRSPTPRRNDYVRSTVFVAPATALIPPNNQYNVANINVPMDDTNTAFYFIAWGHPAQHAARPRRGASSCARRVGVDLDETYRPLRTRREQLLAGPPGDEGRQLHRHHAAFPTRTSRCG